jgi:hypothetical protein
MPFYKVLPGKSSFSIIWEKDFTDFRRNFRIDAIHEDFQPCSNLLAELNSYVLTSRNYLKPCSGADVFETLSSQLNHICFWKGIKNRKLTLQEKNFSSMSYVRKHPNFDIYNPVYSLSKVTDSKLIRIWNMLFCTLKEAAKSDLSDRQINLFNKWELSTILLGKENQNGPMSQQLLNIFDVKEFRLPRETEKIKIILFNFLKSGIHRNDEFLTSQIMHGCSQFSILTHFNNLVSNLGLQSSSLNLTNKKLPNFAFTDHILMIASKFSCSHSTIWSHYPSDSVTLEPHVIWKCKHNNQNCDGATACMLTRNVHFLEILCKGSCHGTSDTIVIKKELS